MLLKFWNKDGTINLESSRGEMIDITNDFRTKMLNKGEMCSEKYKVDEGIFFLKKPFFIAMAKKQNRESIEALLIHYKGNKIIITGDKACIFYNSRALNVELYDIDVDEKQGVQIATSA